MKKFLTIITLGLLLFCFTGCSNNKVPLGNSYRGVVCKSEYLYEYELLSCISLADDESYIKFDSNPTNKDDYIVPMSLDLLDTLLHNLNAPDYIKEDILRTTWSMGKQTAEFEGYNDYILTWTYHPDKGIELMCRLK